MRKLWLPPDDLEDRRVQAEKKGIAVKRCPWFASDPAPQQLTAPCRKYQAACTSIQSNRCTAPC